ncbi:MAG: hypothetical protein RBU25_00875 [Lentisphaeria bacterium]|jgi:hypothetical protein|nr:hypothetical protein [Lentisphaeria bacterium]
MKQKRGLAGPGFPPLRLLDRDKLDAVLAGHYGFTDEELDFIVHYDIKYRMGNVEDTGEDDK